MRARSGSAVLVFAAMATVLVAASLRQSPLTWGAHAYAFLPPLARALALTVLAACVLPPVATRAGAIAAAAGRIVRSTPLVLLTAILFGVAFYFLRIGYQFLGDGQLWVDLIAQGKAFYHYEPFSSAAVRFVAAVVSPESPGSAAGTLSVILGAVYVLLTSWLCRAAWRDPTTQGLAWLLLLLHPVLLLFFGYVESYPVVQTLQVCFALVCVAALRSRLPLIVPALVLGIAMASHLLAVSWALALVVPALARARGRPVRGLAAAAGWGVVAVVIAVLLIRGVGASLGEIGTLLRGDRGVGGLDFHWLVSWQHGVDVANELFLLAAPVCVVAAAAVASGVRFRQVWQDDATKLFAAMAVGPALVLLAVPPIIGAARDWDLHATLALPLLLLGMQLWAAMGARARRADAGRVVVLALVAASGWLAVNLNPATAARRFEVLQQPAGTFTPWARAHAAEAIAVYYRDRDKDPVRELQAWNRAVADNPRNPRYTTSVANAAMKLGQLDFACSMYARSYELGMQRFDIVYNLALCGIQTAQPADAERYANQVVEQWPKEWRGRAVRAQARLQLGRPDAALEDLQVALQMAPLEAQVHFLRAQAFRALGQIEQARAAVARALELDPNHAGARQLLADL